MHRRLSRIKNWPELARQAHWSATALAELCRVSARTLRRHFQKYLGQNLKDWLATQRAHAGRELLWETDSIKATAATLGYKQPTNFSRAFKKQNAVCPSHLPPPAPPNPPRLSANYSCWPEMIIGDMTDYG